MDWTSWIFAWDQLVCPHFVQSRLSSTLPLGTRWEPRSFIWDTTWQNQQIECAPGEDSDQPGHPPSLIRVFAVRSMGSWGPKLSSCGQRRLWSDWADAQADLSLRRAHMPFCWFCHEAAQFNVQLIRCEPYPYWQQICNKHMVKLLLLKI